MNPVDTPPVEQEEPAEQESKELAQGLWVFHGFAVAVGGWRRPKSFSARRACSR